MNRIGALIVLGSVVLCGCQAPRNSSFTPAAPNAPAVAASPNSGVPSGAYVAWIPNYDGHLGPVRVTIEIGPPSSSCKSSIFVLPMAQPKTHFTSAIYYAPVSVSEYAVRHGRAYVAATAKLGSDIGTLRVEGLVGSKLFSLLYRDRRGGGTMTAGYFRPCKPPNLQTRVLPTDAFLGTWKIGLDASTFGIPFDDQTATLKITTSVCLTSPTCYAIRLVGQVTQTDSGSLPLMKSPLPYCAVGVWTDDGYWSMEVDSTTGKDGLCKSKPGTGEVNWGSYHWFPPGGDYKTGAWGAVNDPDDEAASAGGPFGIAGR